MLNDIVIFATTSVLNKDPTEGPVPFFCSPPFVGLQLTRMYLTARYDDASLLTK
jgi:hypothetical protein